MQRSFTIFFLLTAFCLVQATYAQEVGPSLGVVPEASTNLDGQNGWVLTKHDPSSYGTAKLSDSDYIEIINESSLFATQTRPPQTTGQFKFKAKHNKTGLFYIYAQTSDNGGQLLFSIQFTDTKGILLEQSNKQVTLLQNYNADQWYLFSIDYDNSTGTGGNFNVQVDGTSYGEFPYVKSESITFDFAQITLGSESTEGTAESAFSESLAPVLAIETEVATSSASDALLLLSITMSSTSISSDLDNGLIVTASLDGVPGVAITSATGTTTSTTSNATTTNSTGVIDFVTDIIADIIDVFLPDKEPLPDEPVIETTPEPVTTSTPPEGASTEPLPTKEIILPEPTEVETLPEPETTPDVIESGTETQDETITTEF